MDNLPREQRIAHLEIHGWVPMKNRGSGRVGYFNEEAGVGFSVRDDSHRMPAGDSSVKTWGHTHKGNSYEPCEWDEVTDWHLDTIDKRLGET